MATATVSDQPERDARRDAWLRTQGVEVLRLSAEFALRDTTDALRMIAARARELRDRNAPPEGELARSD